MSFLIRCPMRTDTPNPLKEWLPDLAWYSIMKMIEIRASNFSLKILKRKLPTDLEIGIMS